MKRPTSQPTSVSTSGLKMEKTKEEVYLELGSQVTEWRKGLFQKLWFARPPADSPVHWVTKSYVNGKEFCLALKEAKRMDH